MLGLIQAYMLTILDMRGVSLLQITNQAAQEIEFYQPR